MTSCTALGSNAQIGQIINCALDMATGSRLLTGIIVFTVLMYALYKCKVPFIPAFLIGLFAVYVFSGAGIMEYGASALFTNLMLIGVMVLGAAIALVFWRLRR